MDADPRMPVHVRDADPELDGQACAAIYAPYVAGTAFTFEYEAPSAHEMGRRIAAAYAWLIAEVDGRPIGYAYGGRHQARAAYRWAADVSVYVEREHRGAGAGRALYTQLFERLRAAGLWTLCAGVTQPNPASDGLHRAMGFVQVGTYRRIGWKAGAWHDVLWWQLDLHPGEPGPPPPELDLPRRS
ncbi:MAG: N-acetyltransferase family protein [Solirubrobacteraceae bacterium]